MVEHRIGREEVRGAKLYRRVTQRTIAATFDLAGVPLVFDRLTEVGKLIRPLFAVPTDVPTKAGHRVVTQKLWMQSDKLRHLLIGRIHSAGAVERAGPVERLRRNESVLSE